MREKSTSHYVVTCVGCGGTAEFCPKRSAFAAIDGRYRAVGAFRRAGWKFEVPYDHGMRQRAYETALERGEPGEWTCPDCVRLAHPSDGKTTRDVSKRQKQ